MTAVACLRVDVTGQVGTMPQKALEPLVHKFASAYLEVRWAWPRRFTPLTAVSFLLTDPKADDLDIRELRRLSDELQRHLFGVGDVGEVALLVFEGSHPAVTQFAAMDRAQVTAALSDPTLLPVGGHLTRIRPESVAAAATPVAPSAPSAPSGPSAPSAEAVWTAGSTAALKRLLQTTEPPAPAWEGVQGVYFIPRELFYGDVVMYIPQNGKTHLCVVDGPEHMPRDPAAFDAACAGIAATLLAGRPKGSLIFVPVCFTSLARPSQREAYMAALAELPQDRRAELAATIYDVPRDPAFTGLRQARAVLEANFATIDLRISDPGFEIEKLPLEAVNSVTLVLPDGDSHVRLSAMKRFGERLVHYKQRRIWPAVTNVRRRAELEAAVQLRIPFVTGPAVCSPMPTPVGGRHRPMANLPMSLSERPGALQRDPRLG